MSSPLSSTHEQQKTAIEKVNDNKSKECSYSYEELSRKLEPQIGALKELVFCYLQNFLCRGLWRPLTVKEMFTTPAYCFRYPINTNFNFCTERLPRDTRGFAEPIPALNNSGTWSWEEWEPDPFVDIEQGRTDSLNKFARLDQGLYVTGWLWLQTSGSGQGPFAQQVYAFDPDFIDCSNKEDEKDNKESEDDNKESEEDDEEHEENNNDNSGAPGAQTCDRENELRKLIKHGKQTDQVFVCNTLIRIYHD